MTTSWELIRLWHFEMMEVVIDSPSGVHFVRTTYVSTPARWKDLAVPEIAARLEQLLDVHYRHRWHTMTIPGEPVERILPFGFDYEWVTRDDMPPRDSVAPFIFPVGRANPYLHKTIIDGMFEIVSKPRPGIAAECLLQAFDAFRIDADDSWHMLDTRDRRAALCALQQRYAA
ncbi:MAG TPA: hypothetical protein VGM39_03215 [Kofleriaceae bacterium]|jgi:hypothetical protein